ncbi:MFS transporter, DHA1 family, bicyclomycin/chloramphenicol resistance protein [Andreprevotia lacus DSM 23236]|jgi:DHA1 family bicyclomycin/chloramphenicol resistance-like MFS transporter|uniref:Bcr/CflA family efflux transporter n=1 Tax=Andreprevotia lacus DSM 23236 TaxID=1121001 RepID=A0A1W1Y173_9NEIS|nr:multidrug effflux MFS transporter [Andreprevotia lacus]SMC29874.1 MFS transporter, DHA1 family, bicyclomycin/chloramphenicol resistance protein [Andreprevotia lacus DSM 23236]
MRQHHFFRTAVILGLLSAIGPFAIDMYLPALPSIGASLHASTGAVLASLMAFFIALGIGQIIYGPVSDMVGRKPPLYFGLLLFAAGSVGCALAPDIQTLIVLRFFQGLGACAGMVIPRAVVRDLHTGNDAARLMSLLMLVFSVSPILAPLSGSFLIEWQGWRAVFWAVLVAAVLGLVLLATSLPETRGREERVNSSVAGALAAYGELLRDVHFLGLVFIGAFGIASFFAYLAHSSFVLIEHYGLTPRQYSFAFAANAASFIGVSQFTGRLAGRFGLVPMVRVAVGGYALVMVVLLALNLAGFTQLPVMIALLFVGYGFLGLVVPATAVLALEEHGAIAGTASALMGTLQFVVGALTMWVVGLFVNGTARPMIAGITGAAVLAFLLARITLRKGGHVQRMAEQAHSVS